MSEIGTIDKILKKAKMSEPLREAMIELKDSLQKGNLNKAVEVSSVKSYIMGKMMKPKTGQMFSEDSDYNEKKLGRSVYSLIDIMHHNLAFANNTIPSGMTVFSSGGVLRKGKAKGRGKTIKLIQQEDDWTRQSVMKGEKNLKKVI